MDVCAKYTLDEFLSNLEVRLLWMAVASEISLVGDYLQSIVPSDLMPTIHLPALQVWLGLIEVN